MRENILKFVKLCAETLPLQEPIYEFGALQVPGQEGFADLRTVFPGKKYVGTDMREGPGVDKVINLHNMKLSSKSVGTALILDTIEHVEFPRRAIENIHKILKKNCYIIISSHMNFPIHSYPNDYWRFTPEGLKSLLKPFKSIFVDFGGKAENPHSVFGFACKGKIQPDSMEKFTKEYEKLKWWWKKLEEKLNKE
jgi:hypothetical protein